mmetsp:Transcript_5377/g.9556  ORF Transcript_5377/g.9556 Transcript_5377/m.9556 type:complete len:406 (-) Transcript_5377:25-1242(-)|eukprot:CAMPEP_0203744936 /NCGR_PEP_ID=MMETSP0098-20131031/840_1 /ASSEMBLY_ACC=CAM_ASM_000208 /TAXON_ID=96639 /ORGANISM=" , Strain NY0313808BC1" /LENGTH=405 /DNA_ID=CAMNT_0050632579 /DNA_START=128 /DNA_END=1345 /DNA_ORIENTATION=+
MTRLNYEKMMPQLISGPGSVKQVGAVAKRLGIQKVLVVTDEVLVKLGVVDGCLSSLKDSGIEYVLYDKVLPDPKIQQVLEGSELYTSSKCNGIVAIGGGSSIDCAKVIGAHVVDPKPLEQFAGIFKVRKKLPPFIAIPTTHGTGSEVTFAAVISSDTRKFLCNDFKLIPKVSILDPQVVMGLPPPITAAVSMDALTHALEAYLSPWSTEYSAAKCRKAIYEILTHLPACYHNGKTDIQAREALMKASFDAGIGISCCAVGYVHAIAHNIGFRYKVPHGVGNAMVLPYVLEFYGAAAHEKLAGLAVDLGISSADTDVAVSAQKLITYIKDMQKDMDMPAIVEKLDEAAIPDLAKAALAEAHGELHSMVFNFSEFVQDGGYPTIKYMSHTDCESLLRKLVPGPSSRL